MNPLTPAPGKPVLMADLANHATPHPTDRRGQPVTYPPITGAARAFLHAVAGPDKYGIRERKERAVEAAARLSAYVARERANAAGAARPSVPAQPDARQGACSVCGNQYVGEKGDG